MITIGEAENIFLSNKFNLFIFIERYLCSEHVKLHHTMERLSEFSTRAYRRIYYALMERLQHMYKIEILILVLHALVVIQAIKFLESVVSFIFKLFSDCLFSS